MADVAHLLAELIENATAFSPPTRPVLVRSHLAPGEPRGFVVSIEDVGLGMSDDERARANQVLADAPEVDLRRATMLGFHVVARLAARYGITVSVAPTPGGGLTSLVRMPADLVSERSTLAPVGAPSGWPGGPGAAIARGGPVAAALRGPRPRAAVATPDRAVVRPACRSGARHRPSPAPTRAVAAPPVVAATDATATGLVRRVPGEHLAPALRGVPSPTHDARRRPHPSRPAGRHERRHRPTGVRKAGRPTATPNASARCCRGSRRASGRAGRWPRCQATAPKTIPPTPGTDRPRRTGELLPRRSGP